MFGIELQTLSVAQAFAAATISSALAVYLVPQWRAPSARYLLLLLLSVAVWSATYGMEFKSVDLETKLWWVRTEYLGAVWVGVFYFQFAMTITGRVSWLKGVKSWSLFLVPALTIIAVYTNDHHQLIWSKAWIDTSGPIPSLAYHRGPGFWIYVAYAYGLLAAGTVVLIQGHLFNRQIESRHFWVMLIGVLAPWLSNIVYLAEFEPLRHIDLTPASFTISGIAFFWGIVHHQMLGLIPVARDAVIESMQDAVFVLDPRNRVIDINSAAQDLLSPTHENIIGKPLPRLYPELFIRVEQSRLDGCEDVEMTLTDKNGLRFWRLRQTPLHGSGNTLSGWLLILQDVTEQKRSEAAIRESEEKFRSISDSALDGIIMIDPGGSITFLNRAAEKLFGYRAEELLGKNLHETLAPESYLDKYRQGFPGFRRTGSGPVVGKTVEINCRRKNGETFPAELSVAPLQLNDHWHAVGIVRDITERKKTQEYLIQSEKMLSVGGLAAGMAHEINNPLAGILANVQVMRMRLLGDLPDNVAAAKECGIDLKNLWAYMGRRGILRKIEGIDQSCQRAAAIVRNMLAFSRKSDAAFADTDLASLVDQTLGLAKNDFQLSDQHEFRKIRIDRHYQPKMPKVPCDPSQIQQVVFNILKNGAQAMWEQESAHPEPRFALAVDRQDEWACITIANNGPSIPEEIRKRIFEPFYTTKPTGAGTGLGLSIAYFIVTENHAGRLTVESPPGGGTVFTIKLPLN